MKRLIYVLFIFLIYSCSEKEEIETQTCEEGCFKIISSKLHTIKYGYIQTSSGRVTRNTYTYVYLIKYECDDKYRDILSKGFLSGEKEPKVNDRLCDIKLISNYP
jgi:hypothetical protein